MVISRKYYGSGGMNTKPQINSSLYRKKRVDKTGALGVQYCEEAMGMAGHIETYREVVVGNPS